MLTAGCTSSVEAPCSLEFRSFNVTVLTPEGERADAVDISVIIGDSSESLDPCTEVYNDSCSLEGDNGLYVIFHDGFKEQIAKGKNVLVTVRGVRGETSFSQEYIFTNDGCHIRKVEGPDTITLQAN